MKIAIYHNLPSGGAKRALCEITSRLHRAHTVDVYTLSSAEHDFCDLRPHCRQHRVFPFRPLPLARSPFGRVNQLVRVADLLRLNVLQRRIAADIAMQTYDVVFVHHCRIGQSPALMRFLRTPIVYFCHEPPRQLIEKPGARPIGQTVSRQRLLDACDPLPGLYKRLLLTMDQRNVHAADLVLVNSAYSRETLYRVYGIFAQVCSLGVDAALFRPLNLPKEQFVLSVGQLHALKGFDFLIRSLAKLPVGQRPRLIIACNAVVAQEEQHLRGLASELGVSLEIRPRVSDDELVQLYNRALFTVYAPVMEPFGFVPIESMACATPVVGVREAGVRETVVDGVNGVLVDRDELQFAHAVAALLADPLRRDQLGRQAREHVARCWSWDATIRNVERALLHAAQTGASSSRA